MIFQKYLMIRNFSSFRKLHRKNEFAKSYYIANYNAFGMKYIRSPNMYKSYVLKIGSTDHVMHAKQVQVKRKLGLAPNEVSLAQINMVQSLSIYLYVNMI